jgi:hypothetical protein
VDLASRIMESSKGTLLGYPQVADEVARMLGQYNKFPRWRIKECAGFISKRLGLDHDIDPWHDVSALAAILMVSSPLTGNSGVEWRPTRNDLATMLENALTLGGWLVCMHPPHDSPVYDRGWRCYKKIADPSN